MKTVSYSLTYKLNSALILLLTFFASFYCFLTANLYAAKYIPVSFPYRDTGTIRESYRNVIAKIPGFARERKIVNLLIACLLLDLTIFRISDLLKRGCKCEKKVVCGFLEGR